MYWRVLACTVACCSVLGDTRPSSWRHATPRRPQLAALYSLQQPAARSPTPARTLTHGLQATTTIYCTASTAIDTKTASQPASSTQHPPPPSNSPPSPVLRAWALSLSLVRSTTPPHIGLASELSNAAQALPKKLEPSPKVPYLKPANILYHLPRSEDCLRRKTTAEDGGQKKIGQKQNASFPSFTRCLPRGQMPCHRGDPPRPWVPRT